MSGEDIIKRVVDHIPAKKRPRLSIGVLASGGGSNLQALIDLSKSRDAYFDIAVVLTNNPGAGALARAEKVGIANYLADHRTFSEKKDFEAQLLKRLQEHNVELVVLAGFLRVLTPHFLRHYDNRIVNLHPSLLPKHKGLHAIEKRSRRGMPKLVAPCIWLMQGLIPDLSSRKAVALFYKAMI